MVLFVTNSFPHVQRIPY